MLKQRGFVLLLILIFLLIFSILGFAILQKNILQVRLIGVLWEKQTLRMNALTVLNKIEKSFKYSIPPCILLKPIDGDWLIREENEWWKSASCAGNFNGFQYYYVIEFLGQDDCTFVNIIPGVADKKVAYFYRISMMMVPASLEAKVHMPRVILQSLFLKAGLPKNICKGSRGKRVEGRQDFWEVLG